MRATLGDRPTISASPYPRVLLWFNSFGALAPQDRYAWRLAVDAYSRTWPGWRVVWAYDGGADLVDYVGGHAEWVRQPQPPPTQLYRDGRPDESAPVDFLVTVTRDGPTDAYESRAGPNGRGSWDPTCSTNSTRRTSRCRTVPLAACPTTRHQR